MYSAEATLEANTLADMLNRKRITNVSTLFFDLLLKETQAPIMIPNRLAMNVSKEKDAVMEQSLVVTTAQSTVDIAYTQRGDNGALERSKPTLERRRSR